MMKKGSDVSAMTSNPESCPQAVVNRVINTWKCNVCAAEFKPVNPKHRTRW
jgi:hypothetical protein